MDTKLESVTTCTHLETAAPNSRTVDGDTAPVPVTTVTLLPLTMDPALQLNIPTKETEDNQNEETTKMPEGVTNKNELKSEHMLVETTVPTLDTDTVSQEDKALVSYFIIVLKSCTYSMFIAKLFILVKSVRKSYKDILDFCKVSLSFK